VVIATTLVALTTAQDDEGLEMTSISLGPSLTHMVQDNETGWIYVAGKNRIYVLDSNLRLIQTAVTGPKEDSYNCLPPPHDECLSGRRMTDNYNKVSTELF
jgi:hypothetical protein